jgi:hypothetical protein
MTLAAVAAATGLLAGIHAQERVSLPPEVVYVSSGGWWKTDKLQGTYRVIVRTGGFEHIVSQAQVDWVTGPTSSEDSSRVVASKIAETGSWRLDNPRFVRRSGKWYVEFQAAESHVVPTPRGTWIVELGNPGEMKSRLRTR